MKTQSGWRADSTETVWLLPDEVARIIDRFSQPGQTVLGLFCGAGTSLVEAVYAGRVRRGRTG
jgi:hypothetical protein